MDPWMGEMGIRRGMGKAGFLDSRKFFLVFFYHGHWCDE